MNIFQNSDYALTALTNALTKPTMDTFKDFELKTCGVTLDSSTHTYTYDDGLIAHHSITEVISKGKLAFPALPKSVQIRINKGTELHNRLSYHAGIGSFPYEVPEFAGMNLLIECKGIDLKWSYESERSFVAVVKDFRTGGISIGGTVDLWNPDKGIVIEYKSSKEDSLYHYKNVMQLNTYMGFLGAKEGYLVYADNFYDYKFSPELFYTFIEKLRDYDHNKFISTSAVVFQKNDSAVSDFKREEQLKRILRDSNHKELRKELRLLLKKNKEFINALFKKRGYSDVLLIVEAGNTTVRLKPVRTTVDEEFTYKILKKISEEEDEPDYSYPC